MKKLNIGYIGIIILFANILIGCNENRNVTSSDELKKAKIMELVADYGLSGHINLTEDFDYNTSLEEVTLILQDFSIMHEVEQKRLSERKHLTSKINKALHEGDINTYEHLLVDLQKFDELHSPEHVES